MTRFVICPGTALRLAGERAAPAAAHALVAPTLLRSQILTALYQDWRAGTLERHEANVRLDHIRGLRIRLLGDRVLQSRAWTIADQLSLGDTLNAEYIALTQLQADAFICSDNGLAGMAAAVVKIAAYEALFE